LSSVILSSVFALFVLACFALFVEASIPSRRSLRFNEVTGNHLGPNAVGRENVQDFSIDTQALRNREVTNAKISPLAINADQVAPGAITASGASLDLVKLYIRNDDTIPADSQGAFVTMPENAEAVQPFEAIQTPGTVQVDDPDPTLSYRVEGKARGPGVILGWYPSENGHLLRYQSSRALRGIVCSAIDVEDIPRNSICECDTDPFGDCDCQINIAFQNVDFNSDILNCDTACTVLDCNSPNNDDPDPMCVEDSADPRMNPLDDEDDFLPDRCSPYTSVEDVNNAQEGVPVYSPSIERITIDNTGRVEMHFFGRGTVEGAHDPITITVVVLLDDQYGA